MLKSSNYGKEIQFKNYKNQVNYRTVQKIKANTHSVTITTSQGSYSMARAAVEA